MKNTNLIPLLVVSLCSFSVLAAPMVGDQAILAGTYSAPGASLNVSIQRTITSYDVGSDSFGIEQVQTVGSSMSTSNEVVPGDQILSEELAAYIVVNCGSGIGTNETITVKAGTFDTCRVLTDDGVSQYWIAPAPLGLVKIYSPAESGAILSLELESYRKGSLRTAFTNHDFSGLDFLQKSIPLILKGSVLRVKLSDAKL